MSRLTVWGRDLGFGLRFAVTGGREGWTRTVLTAVGVGLGVALLLITTAVPSALAARSERGDARTDVLFRLDMMPKGDDTVLVGAVDTTFRTHDIRGRVYQPEGPDAPLPPGVSAYPKPGEVLVSPSLRELLDSPDGALLRERLDAKVVGTLGDDALLGPTELVFHKGASHLDPQNDQVERIDAFGTDQPPEQMDPVLLLLTLIVFVVLLMPVAVFIAAAVRFGGERRDRRLAALRLIGADGRMVRRIAAGEALAGALLGLLAGTVFFLLGRQSARLLELSRVSVFPHDLSPAPALVVLVLLAVPAAAVGVTLLALRGVVIEPLGVVRTAKPTRRRLWWRLLLPLAGLALLTPMIGQGRDQGDFNQTMVTSGVVLLLLGVTALLPWLVEFTVSRLGGGSVSWQLAVRRLQLSSGTAARTVSGIAVAVAGAIALQMLFAGVESDYTRSTGEDPERARMSLVVPPSPRGMAQTDEAYRALRATRGVTHVTPPLGTVGAGDRRKDSEETTSVTVGSCTALREVAKLPSCREGDVFAVTGAEYDTSTAKLAKPGRAVYLDPSYAEVHGKALPWKVPADLKRAAVRKDPTGMESGGFLFTTKAFPAKELGSELSSDLYLRIDPAVPDAPEYVRNASARIDPLVEVRTLTATERTGRFASIRTGLFVGATCVLLLIGASLLVSQLEQLRERRKLLSSLVAFGTRRRTLTLSVLWQAAVPITLGLALAGAVGLGLGSVLLKMVGSPVDVAWVPVASMTGVGAGVVLLVTSLSLPALVRLMRAEGLRTE
ncbi:ABC transporter permease [Streptomyces luteolus]|uniref:ABC transporter permease n=1 Tax=Streptomyces luteolus TaxID=3043615 RepID=A0ABT6SV69_9ACTN|nr:FtsX-like permease family protein [Streptomyces sp. B-S-A12]MDI3419489.1 ABC transporter permease [Streptomyces sp. B-S-A12]